MADAPPKITDNLPGYKTVSKFAENLSKNSVNVDVNRMILGFIAAIGVFFFIDPTQTVYNFELLAFLSPIWVPIVLYQPAITRFIQTKRAEFRLKQKYLLLEIRIPREVAKSPAAMEVFLSAIHISSGEGTWFAKYINGSVRPWFSLEIVSIGGRIHFYIWTRSGFRRAIESALYGQFPDLEIIEAEDYSRIVDPSSEEYAMFGTEFTKAKNAGFPIKSYNEYGLGPGADNKSIDPLAQLIELLGSISPEEQLWLQLIIRFTKDEKLGHKKTKDGKPYTWRDEALDDVASLREKSSLKQEIVDPLTGKIKETKIGQLTQGQNDAISALEKNIGKQGFDVGIRTIYLAKKDKFHGPMVGAMINMWKPFNNENNNTIRPLGNFSAQFNDYPWEDRSRIQHKQSDKQITKFYRHRAYYFDPYVGPWTVMSTEELATIFHIPSAAVATPNLPRIQSATAGAPANLPQ